MGGRGELIQIMRVLSRLTRVAALAATAAVALTAAPMAASAATTGPAKVSAAANLPRSNYRSPVVYLAPSGTANGATPQVTGNGSSISGYHGVSICPEGCGTLAQRFDTTYQASVGVFTSCFQNMNGTGYASWGGTSPFNADNMTLNQNIWVSGVGVAISISTSPGASVSISNNTIYFSEAATNNWQLSHSFTNARFCTKLAMTGPYENSRDSATFGTHTYTDFIN